MKFLMASHNCEIVGGVERFLYDTSVILKSHGHQLAGLFEKEGSPPVKDLFDEVWIRSSGLSDERIFGEIAAFSPDAVVVHKTTDAAFLSELNRRFKTIAVVHDHDYYCIRRHKYFPFNTKNCTLPFGLVHCSICSWIISKASDRPAPVNPFERLALLREVRKCRRLIVISEFMRKNLIVNGFRPDAIRKIRPPVQVSQAQRSENARNGPLRILFVGQLIRGKGADLLVAAAKLLKTEFSLRIAGFGNDDDFVRQAVSDLGLSGRVEFFGRLSDIGVLYEWANVTVVPSRWQEPFGLIGIESMSHSRPVVAFDVGGISEWLKDGVNGCLVKHGDIQGMADALDRIAASEEDMRRMGAAGLEMVCSEYSDESFLEGFIRSLEG